MIEKTVLKLTKKQKEDLIKFAPELFEKPAKQISIMLLGQAYPESGEFQVLKVPRDIGQKVFDLTTRLFGAHASQT
jgi:hypothetical protein